MSDGYTCTTDHEAPELTFDVLRQLWEELKPPTFYRTSKYVPQFDDAGKPVYFSVPYLDLTVDGCAVPAPKDAVIYIHPDNFPYLQAIAAREGFRLQQAK